jgi:hypothetical protein
MHMSIVLHCGLGDWSVIALVTTVMTGSTLLVSSPLAVVFKFFLLKKIEEEHELLSTARGHSQSALSISSWDLAVISELEYTSFPSLGICPSLSSRQYDGAQT